MQRKDALRVAAEAIRHLDLSGAPGDAGRARSVTLDAIGWAAEQLLPDGAPAAAVRLKDGTSAVVSVDGEQLYVLQGVAPESEMAAGTATCRLLALEPARDLVEVRVSYKRSSLHDERDAVWSFQVQDVTFTVETAVDEDGAALPPAEDFAQALARAHGWKFGSEPGE